MALSARPFVHGGLRERPQHARLFGGLATPVALCANCARHARPSALADAAGRMDKRQSVCRVMAALTIAAWPEPAMR
eukprot:297846-Chlamydomonas_euryale.AAC.21